MISLQKKFTADYSIAQCRTAIRLDLFWAGTLKNEVNENCFEFKNLAVNKGFISNKLGQYVVIYLEQKTENETTVLIQTSPFSSVEASNEEWQNQMEELTEIVWSEIYQAIYKRNNVSSMINDMSKAEPAVKPQTSNATDTKANNTSFYTSHKKAIWIGAIIFIAVIVLVIVLVSGSDSGGTLSNKDSRAVSAAKQIILEDLKDPSSAVWNESKVMDKDNYDRYIVYLDYSAKNGFGGMNRSRYYVYIMLGEGSTFYYNRYIKYYDADYFSVDSVKDMLEWNEPPKE